MGQFVAICGSLGEGVTVFGPYKNKLAAMWDTDERVRCGWCDASLIDFLPLVPDNEATGGEWVLILGNIEEGYAVYGRYAGPALASGAASLFRPDPINPDTHSGLRHSIVMKLQPPMTS